MSMNFSKRRTRRKRQTLWVFALGGRPGVYNLKVISKERANWATIHKFMRNNRLRHDWKTYDAANHKIIKPVGDKAKVYVVGNPNPQLFKRLKRFLKERLCGARILQIGEGPDLGVPVEEHLPDKLEDLYYFNSSLVADRIMERSDFHNAGQTQTFLGTLTQGRGFLDSKSAYVKTQEQIIDCVGAGCVPLILRGSDTKFRYIGMDDPLCRLHSIHDLVSAAVYVSKDESTRKGALVRLRERMSWYFNQPEIHEFKRQAALESFALSRW